MEASFYFRTCSFASVDLSDSYDYRLNNHSPYAIFRGTGTTRTLIMPQHYETVMQLIGPSSMELPHSQKTMDFILNWLQRFT